MSAQQNTDRFGRCFYAADCGRDPLAVGHVNAKVGASHQRLGRVTLEEVADGGEHLRARVTGELRRSYDVDIRLTRAPRGLRLRTVCSCPTGGCEHVAATLYELLHRPSSAAEVRAEPPPSVLPQALAAWLATLDVARRGEKDPKEARQRVIYVITVKPAGSSDRLMVQPMSERVLKDGKSSESAPTPYQPSQALLAQPPRFLRPSDIEILAAIHRESMRAQYYASHGTVIAGPGSGRLLEEMIATGRCHWETRNSQALKLGPPRRAQESGPPTPRARTPGSAARGSTRSFPCRRPGTSISRTRCAGASRAI